MKNIRPALVLTLFFVLLTGFVFPAAVTAIAQSSMSYRANGSFVVQSGKVVGSELIGQTFSGSNYFHSRPSAAGNGYDANNSSGTNLGPTNPKLLVGVEGFEGIQQLAAKYRLENQLSQSQVIPVDAVTRSASGLDPDISVENARLQIPRIARARKISEDSIQAMLAQTIQPRFAGIFGDPSVNVLRLNMLLDKR